MTHTAENDALLADVKVLIRDLGDMACIGCRNNTCPACGLAAEITNRVHVLLRVIPPAMTGGES